MLDLINDNGFFRKLFEILPSGMVLVDKEARVKALNPAGSRMFCVAAFDSSANLYGGDLFQCINAKDGCGSAAACQECILRTNAMLAINGQTTSRQKGKFCIIRGNDIKQFTLQVTATSLVYKDTAMALLIIEDISLITGLSGLIPICSMCHKICNKQGDWVSLGKYIQEHSEAELTHDYCPSCAEELLNNLQKRAR